MTENVINVRQLNMYVRSLIEGDLRLANILVSGEISNFKNHYSSGHWYFTLKDDAAAIRCVMFRSAAATVRFTPEDGARVILRGRASLYEKDGQYQFYAEEMFLDGIGDINAEFERLKEKLEKEGLFDADSKRSLPRFPKKIAVVTSDTGAAVRDIFNILERRWPLATIIMCPVAVQGENAVPSMLKVLDSIYEGSLADIIIIGRGGGSKEDLWAFNNEALARKIYESPVPVISAVGHETDFTICDFVADLRAPTPSAAAELAVPDIEQVRAGILKYEGILRKSLKLSYSLSLNKFTALTSSHCLKYPVDFIVNRRTQQLDNLSDRITKLLQELLNKDKLILAEKAAALDGLSPLKALSRGFAAVTKDSKTVSRIAEINVTDELRLRFSDGTALCKVTGKINNENGE